MVTVRNLMTRDVLVTSLDKSAVDAARIMRSESKSSLVVVDAGRPVAILTNGDIIRKVVAEALDPSTVRVRDIMSSSLVTVGPDDSLRTAARLMLDKKVRRLPVVNDGKLLGIVSATDFAKHLGRKSIAEEMLDALSKSAEYPTIHFSPPILNSPLINL
jgi:CBS domain-containing protein